MNQANYDTVIAKITENPDCWDQTEWHCGTTHCFAGWAQILSGRQADGATTRRDARRWLELTWSEANYLFDAKRTIKDFRDGYGRAGYHRAGYDSAGYDSQGYGRDGYGRGGYFRDGYDSDGYNRAGYGRDGYGRDGYDSDGLDVNFKERGENERAV